MVVGYHLIWTAYGWWLPNDPRGSSSHEIRCADIVGLGELHHGRKKVQPAAGEIRRFYEVEDNPKKAKRSRQMWDFVVAYDGWLPGLAPR
jgi:hypothetical protein